MSKRFALILILIFLPMSALAEDAVPTDTVTPEPQATAAPDAPASASDGLGPQSSSLGSGGSNADATALQPAGQSPLQSTVQDATGLVAPNANALQAPVTGDDTLKVLATESDGEPQHTTEPNSLIPWLVWTLIIGLLVATGALWLSRRSKTRRP